MDLTGEVIDVHLHLVEASRRHGEAQQPVDPDHAVPARGKREGMEQAALAHVVRLGALADLAGPHVGVDVARLPRPVGEPADKGGRLVAAEVPAQRGVVALLQDVGPQHPPVRHTQPVCFSLSSAVEQAAANDEGAACWACVAGATG